MQYRFDNGYGASIIDDGYGSDRGLKELGVTHGGRLCYKTPITNDVIGWLKDEDVQPLVDQIRALPANELCDHRWSPTD